MDHYDEEVAEEQPSTSTTLPVPPPPRGVQAVPEAAAAAQQPQPPSSNLLVIRPPSALPREETVYDDDGPDGSTTTFVPGPQVQPVPAPPAGHDMMVLLQQPSPPSPPFTPVGFGLFGFLTPRKFENFLNIRTIHVLFQGVSKRPKIRHIFRQFLEVSE